MARDPAHRLQDAGIGDPARRDLVSRHRFAFGRIFDFLVRHIFILL
jgi:hypothetical protein